MENDDDATTIREGSRVRVRQETGPEMEFVIRGDLASTPPAGTINVLSPMAQGLLGHRAGEEVEVEVHSVLPPYRMTILSVENPPAD